jgi:hypothetical protein
VLWKPAIHICFEDNNHGRRHQRDDWPSHGVDAHHSNHQREALGNVPAPEMAAWIATKLGMTVQPVIVTVMLGSFLEEEILEQSRLKALELIEQATGICRLAGNGAA